MKPYIKWIIYIHTCEHTSIELHMKLHVIYTTVQKLDFFLKKFIKDLGKDFVRNQPQPF